MRQKRRLLLKNSILIIRVLNGCKTVYKEILFCVLASANHNFLGVQESGKIEHLQLKSHSSSSTVLGLSFFSVARVIQSEFRAIILLINESFVVSMVCNMHA